MEKIENEKIYKIILAIFTTIIISIITIFSIFCIGLSKVEAKTLTLDDNQFAYTWGQYDYVPTPFFYTTSTNDRKELHVMKIYDPDTDLLEGYNYIIMEFCSGLDSVIKNAYISNTNYNTDFINDGEGQTYITNNTCYFGPYQGKIIKKQFQVGRWTDEGDGVAYSRAYLNISGETFISLNNIYLSDTDEVSVLAENQQSTDKIIQNQDKNTNNIINNNNTNTDKITQNESENTDKVVDAIEGEGLEDTTPVNPSKKNELEEVEEELLDENITTSLNDIDISIDTNTNEFIWNLVTRIINTNSLIFGLVLTMLSLGVLKLVLNR